ncbi:hypothetical protein MKW92_032085 [Papaver armeniacum]|nr:hypothetical protein MKW92_032085 [Papaver armeniacum]
MCFSRNHKFSRAGYIEFATEEAAKMAVKLRWVDLFGRRIQLDRQAIGTGASKTLCLENLPIIPPVPVDYLHLHFENVADIADVRFSFDHRYETSWRVAHVEFATEEATNEAAKSNGRYLLGRPVRLAIVRETLCVQGYDTSLKADQIRSLLENHFKTCESIVHIDIPETRFYGGCAGVPPGTALIEFSNLQALHRALDLNGKEVDGISLTQRLLRVAKIITKKTVVSSRGFSGAGLGKYGSPIFIPTGNNTTFDND